MNKGISNLISQTYKWYDGIGEKSDIVISSRVRIARNINGYNFPHWCEEKILRNIEFEIIEKLKSSHFFSNIEIFDINEITEDQAFILIERNLISNDFLKNRGRILITNKNKSFFIILNEEDHIRIQIFESGIEVKRAWKKLSEIDDELQNLFIFAFDKKYGYLTSCPTNCGTGLRASIMIHLPALVYTKKISSAFKVANKVGLVVRGIHGEGTESLGNLYQISNQTCLGLTEQEIIDNLFEIGNSLVDYEEKTRQNMLQKSKHEIEDMVWRSYGILTNCRIITTKESFDYLSNLRLGVSLGLIKNISLKKINELYFLIQHAHIKNLINSNNVIERLALRAEIIRTHLLS